MLETHDNIIYLGFPKGTSMSNEKKEKKEKSVFFLKYSLHHIARKEGEAHAIFSGIFYTSKSDLTTSNV